MSVLVVISTSRYTLLASYCNDECILVCVDSLPKSADDFDDVLTSADESELDPLQWKDIDKDAMSNSNALELEEDGAEWSKDFDRDSQSPMSHKRGSRIRCVVVASLVLLVIAGVCVAVTLLRRRMQGATDRVSTLVCQSIASHSL